MNDVSFSPMRTNLSRGMPDAKPGFWVPHKHLRGRQRPLPSPLISSVAHARAEGSGSEDLDRAFQRLPDTPSDGYADEEPEQRGSDVQPALADAERAILYSGRTLRAGRLQLRYLGFAHVPLRIDRLDQVVADQTSDQHRAKDVHGGVVELVAGNAGRKLELTDVVHDHGADDAGSRP